MAQKLLLERLEAEFEKSTRALNQQFQERS